MEKKHIIILIILIAIIAVIGGYFLLNNQQSSEQTTLILSQSAYMEVPKDAVATKNNKVDKKGIFYYVDEKDNVNVTSCSNLSADSSESEMNKLKSAVERGSKKITGDNVVVYLKDGIYSVFVKNTQYNDTILLQSTNKNLLIQCWESIKFHSPTEKLKFNDTSSSSSGSGGSGTVVNAAEKTKSTVKKSAPSTSYSSSSSSSVSSSSSYSNSFGYSSYGSGGSSKKSSGKSSSGGGGGSTPSFGEF